MGIWAIGRCESMAGSPMGLINCQKIQWCALTILVLYQCAKSFVFFKKVENSSSKGRDKRIIFETRTSI